MSNLKSKYLKITCTANWSLTEEKVYKIIEDKIEDCNPDDFGKTSIHTVTIRDDDGDLTSFEFDGDYEGCEYIEIDIPAILERVKNAFASNNWTLAKEESLLLSYVAENEIIKIK